MKPTAPVGLLLALFLSGCPQTSTSNAAPASNPIPSASPVASTAPATPASGDFLIVPGQSFGPITAESTQASLEQQFGKDQVRAGDIPGAEGITQPGLTIFPDQPEKQVSVFLSESEPRRVTHIQIYGEKSQWKTAEGVTLGTTLEELEKLNGKPFELMGLGWDYGGHVTDWKGGALENLNLRLNSTAPHMTEEEMAAISGDKTISSALPELRKAEPHVSEILVLFSVPNVTPTP